MEMKYQIRTRNREYGGGPEAILTTGATLKQAMDFMNLILQVADPNEHVEYVITPHIEGRPSAGKQKAAAPQTKYE